MPTSTKNSARLKCVKEQLQVMQWVRAQVPPCPWDDDDDMLCCIKGRAPAPRRLSIAVGEGAGTTVPVEQGYVPLGSNGRAHRGPGVAVGASTGTAVPVERRHVPCGSRGRA